VDVGNAVFHIFIIAADKTQVGIEVYKVGLGANLDIVVWPAAEIVVYAALHKLLSQLNIGGILVIPEGDSAGQKMIRIERVSEKEYKKSEHGHFSFVPLLRGKNS
jgi:protein-L-isoaspartate O-methyltransferase